MTKPGIDVKQLITIYQLFLRDCRQCCGCNFMEVGFTTTYAISAFHHYCCEFESRSGEVYTVQHYVIKFVNDLQQVGGLLRFPPPIKLTVI